MLEAVLEYLNNWFPADARRGAFAVKGGSIELPDGFLREGQYFRVRGSVFNDGLHRWPATDLTDEEFAGVVEALAVPKAVRDLAEDVSAWVAKNGDSARSPYQSESFGGYSYTKASGTAAEDGSQTWQGAFKADLRRWRRV